MANLSSALAARVFDLCVGLTAGVALCVLLHSSGHPAGRRDGPLTRFERWLYASHERATTVKEIVVHSSTAGAAVLSFVPILGSSWYRYVLAVGWYLWASWLAIQLADAAQSENH